MYRCKTCGQEIDEHQFNNYNGQCPQCIRTQKSSSVTKDAGRSIVLQDKIKGNEHGMGWIIGIIFVALIMTYFALLSNFTLGLLGVTVIVLLILWLIYILNQNRKLKDELNKLM